MSMIKLVGCKLVSNLALRPAIVGQMNAVNGYFWGKDKKFAHPLEHATGEEKMLALAELHGIDDPYDTKIHKRNPGIQLISYYLILIWSICRIVVKE